LTSQRSRSHTPHPVPQDDWGRHSYYREESARGSSPGVFVVLSLVLLAVAVLFAAGFVLLRVLDPNRGPVLLPAFSTWTPTPALSESPNAPTVLPTAVNVSQQIQVGINPAQGYINTLVTVTGEGWWPGEPVFVFLRSPEEGEGQGYSYAAAVADDRGFIRTAFTFPNETRWIGQSWADVIARGSRSEYEAATRFMLLTPTFTSTPPPPTALPTRAPTETPSPTLTPMPTNTPQPSPTPTTELFTDWRGEYFAGLVVAGDPILIRNDAILDFNWGLGSPGWGIPDDGFSARWTRRQYFDEGTYAFTAMADDGVRVWIDGRLYLDEWHDSTQESYLFKANLTAGEHSLHVEFFENLGGARIYVDWALVEQPAPPPVVSPTEQPLIPGRPTELVFPTSEPIPTLTPLPPLMEGWWAEYYANISLDGLAVLTRLDPDLDFNWGTGSPGLGVPADDFSARWTRLANMPAGTYRYSLMADDGARFWLDGTLLIDAWPADPSETYTVQIYLPAGFHVLTVEYFEVTVDARLHLWSEAIP
jgi:hypothetical protein